MSEEKLYTMADAVALGRRALCESSESGHQIARQTRQLNARGELVLSHYGCGHCDVVVELRYPPLAEQGHDTRC